MRFQLLNNITGWAAFLFALVVYTLTLEPTASFWDCGEFIAAAFKLEIVHPPGSPLHALVGRLFTMVDPANAAWMINFHSGLSSAFVVLFVFWSVTHLGRKLLGKTGDQLDGGERLAVMGAGVVAAMAATFVDSFWFSATEGEVYSFSHFFAFAIVWTMLKWDAEADKPGADRWIVLTALLIGLGVGVHLLHLLMIPALAFIYYFRRFQFSWIGAIAAFFVGFFALASVMWGVLDYYVRVGAWMDHFFVNSISMPVTSGFFTFLILVFGIGAYGIVYSRKKQRRILQLGITSFLMLIVGFSIYSIVMLRSSANPPINMNEPKDPYTLWSYLKREQYGSRPLVYGPAFTAQPYGVKESGKTYRYSPSEHRYVVAGTKTEYLYGVNNELRSRIRQAYPNHTENQINQIMDGYRDMNKMMLFPRMGSVMNEDHNRQYRAWLNLKENDPVTFSHNMKFFFNYQLGYMYWRYFAWNFIGRQDDHQGHIDRGRVNGNWMSGIGFIDKQVVGAHLDNLDSLSSRARNKYYFIPLLIGLLGMVYHFRRDPKGAWVVMMLFLFTGLINIINSNQPPSEPRERDYAVALSFVTYAMWIGLGVMALWHYLREKKMLNSTNGAIAGIIVAALAPFLMGSQGWDDHDRSHRYLARDNAIAYLESVAPNAILFTQGDNDTYPLWYAQEVEGIRKDVRVVNLSLLAVDWYVNQLHNAVNDAAHVDIRFDYTDYRGDGLLQTRVEENQRYISQYGTDLNQAMEYVRSQRRSPAGQQQGQQANFPLTTYTVPIDSARMVEMGIVPEKYRANIVKELRASVGKGTLIRDELIVLDMIARNWPERPIYWAVTVDRRKRLGLDRYMQREGFAYRLVPYDPEPNNQNGREFNDLDLMYENMVHKWSWGNMKDHKIYLDETAMRTARMFQGNMIFLGQLLHFDGQSERAKEVMDLVIREFPQQNVPFVSVESFFPVLNTYIAMGELPSAMALTDRFFALADREINYYFKAGEMDLVKRRFGNDPDFLFRVLNDQTGRDNYYANEIYKAMSALNGLVNLLNQRGHQAEARQMRDRVVLLEQNLGMNLMDPALREI